MFLHLVTFYESLCHPEFYQTIDQSFSIISSSPFNKFISDTVRTIPRSKSLSRYLSHRKKKEKPLDPSYISLPPPWTLISNLKQFPISSWNRSENQSTTSSKWKKRERGEKLLSTIPNPLKPSSDLLDLLARPPSTSTGSVGIGPWTQTFVDRGDPLQGIGGEDPEMDEEEEGSGWQWVASRTGTFAWKSWQIGCRATTGSTIASQRQQRRRRRLFLFLNRLDRFFSLPRLTGCLDGLCVFACLASGCVLTRTRRERAEYMGQPTASGHRNATLTHHTHSRHDRAHHRLSRYLGDGCGKERGWRRGLGSCSVSARPTTSFRGCLRSEVVRVWIFNRLEFWEKFLEEKKKPAPRGRGHSILTFLSYYPTGPRRSKPLSNFFPNAPPCPIQRERSVFRPQTLSTRNKATRSLDIVEHRHRYANNFDRENR